MVTIKKKLKIIFTVCFLIISLIFLNLSVEVKAFTINSSVENTLDQATTDDLTINNIGPQKPTLERLGGGGMSLKQMSTSQATNFVKTQGYTGSNAVHDAKTDYLTGITKNISLYNFHYSTQTRVVYLVNSQSYGFSTGGYYYSQ